MAHWARTLQNAKDLLGRLRPSIAKRRSITKNGTPWMPDSCAVRSSAADGVAEPTARKLCDLSAGPGRIPPNAHTS
jgi:hypothetical protein